MASAAFDVFTGDWVRALGTGGRLVLCPRDVLLDPPALLALLRAARIRVAEFVPAIVRLLLSHCRATGERLPALRLLIVGSDTWHGSELADLRSVAATGTRLINSYGVAEATIDSTWFEAGAADVAGPVPVGTPFPGVSVYVLDAQGEPVPRGVPGELCIGGAGVAAGYWNDADLTARKFQPDPHATVAGARLYRTGDRARWNCRGQLELLGRSDAQFKLRGFRIEPAEVEAAIAALPGVAAAAVGLQAPAGDEPRLVAWVVAEDRGEQPDDWQQRLRQVLPEHLVPSVFVMLPSLPLTPNGKVDRAALAAVGAPIRRDRGRSAVAPEGAPTTRFEAVICRLFGEVLATGGVGVDTDFFRAGGHSLLATRLVARLREALRAEIPLRMIFEAPTPRGLAAALGRRAQKSPASAAGIGPRPRPRRTGAAVPDAAAPVVPRAAAARHRGLSPALAAPPARPAGPPRPPGRCGRGGCPSRGAAHGVRRARRRAGPGHRRRSCGSRSRCWTPAIPRRSPPGPSTWQRGRWCGSTLLGDGPQDHRLLIVIHHLVADGWSFGILARELSAAYNAARRGDARNAARLAAAVRGLRAVAAGRAGGRPRRAAD